MDIDEQDLEVGGPKPSSPIDPQSSSMLLPTLVPPLLALIQPTTLSFPPLAAPSPHPPTTSALSSVHISALECLNNIFLSLATSRYTPSSIDHAAGQQVWSSVWNALSVVGTDTSGLGQERRQEIWEMAVGVLWGVGTVWKSTLVSTSGQILMHSTDDYAGAGRRASEIVNAILRSIGRPASSSKVHRDSRSSCPKT